MLYDKNFKVRFEGNLTLADIEREVILQTLKRKNDNRTQTAKALGIGIRTLQRKLKQYGYCEVKPIEQESEVF
jgi:transcriptional regulator with PAS, ATPase and Fis domain